MSAVLLNFFPLIADLKTTNMRHTYSPLDTPATAPDGVIFSCTPAESAVKRAVAFIDGQNLYRSFKTPVDSRGSDGKNRARCLRLAQRG